ncbi:unnamed protein product [Rotaria magnacalcarata]|uniref:RWD domain-containing protein n=1 Tax=Rotaria magnacalcarata TaxID=392030 RepID=A0A816TJV7_9BILA|nr:unnamed protein product [Rotaria magnacalcarata]
MNSIRSCIEQQLNEIELLHCCYPSADEFYFDDIEAITEAKEFIGEKRDYLQRNLGFIIKLHLNDINTTVELQFIYPLHYPESPVDVHLRTYLSRECYEKFNESVKSFLNNKISSQEPYIMEFISWIQDNQTLFLISNDTAAKLTNEQIITKKNFTRLWIYSHHIYNIDKRRNIINWAHELHLNGFSMPGKPGIICVEGQESDVDEYWTRLRNLTWKKLQIKEKESLGDIEDNRLCFNQFQELAFLHDNHTKQDLGQFYQYLQDKQLERMFNLFFGFHGIDKK